MKIKKKYIFLYVLFMVLLFIPFHNYFEKKDKERNNKALDFYESEINMTVNSYLTGWTFTINDIDYKYSKNS